MELEHLLIKEIEKTMIITINRPNYLNAVNNQVIKELNYVIDIIKNSKNIKTGIITGSGEKSFIAGADIKEFLDCKDPKKIAANGQLLCDKIEYSPKPIVACINGFALGGGCEIAMACHFRVASPKAKFGQTEINLGIIPGWGGTQRLCAYIGKSRAIELILTGNIISAEKALEWGLINYIFPSEDLISNTLKILENINNKAPIAIAEAIASINDHYNKDANGFQKEAYGFETCFKSDDAKEGISAFLDKRKPNFTGN